MAWVVFREGVVVERGDDETRQVYDGAGQVIRPYTDAENTAADETVAEAERVAAEAARARIQADLVPATSALMSVLADTQPEIMTAIRAAYSDEVGRADGDPFVKPTGYHNAYPKAAVVTHDGKEWEATRDGANGTPGESPDWIEKVPEGVIPEWEQRHAGSEYEPGAIVQHEGTVYRNDLETPNAYRPDVAHSGWTDLGPIEEY